MLSQTLAVEAGPVARGGVAFVLSLSRYCAHVLWSCSSDSLLEWSRVRGVGLPQLPTFSYGLLFVSKYYLKYITGHNILLTNVFKVQCVTTTPSLIFVTADRVPMR